MDAAKHNIKKVSKNLKEFIYESKDVDAFVIAIKTEATYPLLKILSNKKKPILVEKPGSLQAKDLKKIKFKDKIYFAYNRRFYDSVYWLKKFLKKKNGSFVSVTIPDKIKTDNNEYVLSSNISLENFHTKKKVITTKI